MREKVQFQPPKTIYSIYNRSFSSTTSKAATKSLMPKTGPMKHTLEPLAQAKETNPKKKN